MSSTSPADETTTPPDGDDGYRQLVLVKADQRFVFRYEPGAETEVLTQMLDLARDPESEFDTFDAAVLSHQMGQQLGEKIKRLDKAS